MNSWTIYGKNGVAKAEVNELELHDEWMAECFLTVSVKSAEPIDFAVDDYIDYRGERYAIQYDPTLLKKSRRNTYGEGFSYDNIKFVNEAQAKIVRCDFNDIVLNDNELHYTSLPTFPFYCESVDDLLDRILANLEDLYPGEFTIIGLNTVRNKQRADITHNTRYIEEYKKWIDPTLTPNTDPYGKQGVAETVDNINCWNALAKVHEDFELNFIVRGYTIIVGTVGVFTANKFRYGKGNGLYEIERISDSEQQIVTRLRSYGASTNLPTRYYATLNTQVFGTVTQISANTNYASFLIDLAFSTKYFNYRSESYPGTNEFPNYIVRVKANNHTVKGYVTKDYTTGACSIYCESVNPQEDDRDEPDAAELEAFAQSLSVGTRVYFVNYVEKGAFDSAHTDYATENLPDNMAVSRLMLPGFPNQSLYDWAKAHRDEDTPYDDTKGICTINGFTAAFSKDKYRPYIDSPNADDYGIRPASFYFDGSGDNEDIHPTIEGMTYNNQPIDVIYAADQVADNGVYAEGKSPDPIFITLPVLGFELDQVWKDDASIEMKDGMCGGRSLKIVSKPVKIDGGYWKCKVERVKDESLDLWFPYNDFQIHSGDHYVLVGIDMPDAYVTAASERLFYASLTALQENHAPRFSFQPRIDDLWMQRQHDQHLANPTGVTSLHDTLKSGDIFSFADADMGIDAKIIIDVLTIKENGNNGIPTYEITLRDEKQVSPIQKIQNKVDSLYSGSYNGNSGSGLSGRQIQSLIENEGNSYFLSKINDDEASGVITFLKGLWVKAKELFGITEDGDAILHNAEMSGHVNIDEDLTVDQIQSSEYTGDGMLDTGYKLWYQEGRAKLVIDDLVARGKFTVNELESRIWTYAGGNMIFSGAGSTIFFVEYLDANEETLGYTHINSPWLLAGRSILAAQIAWSKRRAIQRSLTTEEKSRVVKFRCYEYSDDGTMQTRNWWHVNDLAYCSTLNHVKDKTTGSTPHTETYTDPVTGETVTETFYSQGTVSNNVYWRRVASVGSKTIEALDDGRVYDYVDLWNVYDVQGQEYVDTDGRTKTITDNVRGFLNMASSGQAPSADWPAAGDVIVQRGHPLDADRQDCVTIEVQGDVHGLKVYDTINDYTMANKQWIEIGYDQQLKRAKANIYGDFRFGHRPNENGSFISYNRSTGELTIRAKIVAQSTIGDQDINTYVNGLITDITDVIEQQVDKKAETWYQSTNPAQQQGWVASEHVGDMWYCTADIAGTNFKQDTTWRYNSSYQWEQQFIPKTVFDTMDGKASIFVSKPNTIRNDGYCYKKNDMWILEAAYTLSNVAYKAGTIVVATTDSTTWNANHWAKKDMYTDDSAFLGWKADGYASDITGLTNSISSTDGRARSAQSAANAAQTAADNAQSTANTANTNANTANTRLTNWADNGLISPTEKTGLKGQKADIEAEYTQIIADANRYSVGTTAYTTAYNNAITAFNKYTASTPENITVESDYSNISAYYTARQVILNAIAAAAKQYAYDCAQTVSNAHEYLRNALKAKTEILGGLLLTTFINLRQFNGGDESDPANYTTWGGLNGVYENANSIAAWFGGFMRDIVRNPSLTNCATSLFRMDGSGYFAAGKIKWEANGSLEIDGKVTSKEGTIGGFDIGENYLGESLSSTTIGTTFIKKNGHIELRNPSNADGGHPDGAIFCTGGVNLQGDANRAAILSNANGETRIYGLPLNLNTLNSGNTYIGSAQSELISNSSKNTFKNTTEIEGKFILSGNTTFITNNSSTAMTVSLPSNPSRGQVVFAKGTAGNLTLTGAIRNDEGSIVTSVGGDKRSRIFIYGDSYWNEFYCS